MRYKMSLISALDDSENSSSHGWSTSSRFGIDNQAQQSQQWESGQGGGSNLYHQRNNQNNTGEVPDALAKEEIIYEENSGQESVNNSQALMQQQKRQQPKQHQTQHIQHHTQQQSVLQKQQQQQQQQQQQRHYQVVNSSPKTPQKVMYSVVQGNQQQQHQNAAGNQRHTPTNNAQQMRHNFQQQQQQQHQLQFQNKSPHQTHPSHQVSGVNAPQNNQLETLTEDEKVSLQLQLTQEQISATNKQIASLTSLGLVLPQSDPNSSLIKSSPQMKNFGNCDYLGSVRTQNQQQQHQQQQQIQSSDTINSVRQLLLLNNSKTNSGRVDVEMVDNLGARNSQSRNLLQHQGGISSVPQSPVITLSSHRPKTNGPGQTMTSPALTKTTNSLLGNPKSQMGGARPSANQNPVQVPSISTNQNRSVLNNPMPKISRQNVVLEGGGQFEEGQAYMIKDRHGNSKTMMWKDGNFVPMEMKVEDISKHSKIQHPAIDSSQRGRGRGRGGNRGRGRGQQVNMQGNASGVHMDHSSMRGISPGINNIRVQVPQLMRSPLTRAGIKQQIRFPTNSYRQPNNIVIHQISQGTNRSQVIPVRVQGQQTQSGQMRPVLLQNLMPAAQGSQPRVGPGSPTNIVRQQGETETKPVAESAENISGTEAGAAGDNKEELPDKPEDLPNIPKDPNYVAVCQFCGTTSDDKLKCESCKRKFTSATKFVAKNSQNVEGPDEKRRKVEGKDGDSNTVLDKKSFYTKHLTEQNQVYTQILNMSNNSVVTTTIQKNPRIITRGTGIRRGRGTGRGRGSRVFVPETVTISSDEEDGEHHHHHVKKQQQQMSAPATPVSKGNKSPSHADQAECPESPLIPNIPISTRAEQKGAISRRDKMEDELGASRASRERSISPSEIFLNARLVRAGTFKGIPVEPVLLSKNGINFFIEGAVESHKFHIYPQEIQQCLARFDDQATNMLFFLTSAACGVRTRKDLNIKPHTNPNLEPPEPFFDPCSVDMTHQMITVLMDTVDEKTRIEFQKHMDTFKSWGKQGDEGFYMELTRAEADEILKQSNKQSNKKMMVADNVGMLNTPLVPDHQYSQPGDEESRMSRSPSPPKIGFVGPIIKLLTYPPPPEKGGHSITNEDLYCLQEGEFLNDVIIDFYLKYLLLECLSAEDRARTHVFSSFFYKRLTQRIRGAAIDDDPCVTLPVKRHARVKTWTRHVDLFKKDFIVIPINEHAHWFLAIICFPGVGEPEENPFIPKPVTTPMIEPTNVPTPPQPTEDNSEEMECDDVENPLPQNQQEKVENMDTQENSDIDNPNSEEAIEKPEQEKPSDGSNPSTSETGEPGKAETEANGSVSEESSTQGAETAEVKTESQTETDAKIPSLQTIKYPVICKSIRGTPVAAGQQRPDDALVGVKQPCIIIFDSLSGPSRSRIVQVLKDYLMVEWAAKKGGELNKNIIKGCVPKVPQQNNFSDCGVFMLQYVESFFEDPIQDFTTPMKGIHDWFSISKIEGKREEIRDLIIDLKEKQESKSEVKDNT